VYSVNNNTTNSNNADANNSGAAHDATDSSNRNVTSAHTATTVTQDSATQTTTAATHTPDIHKGAHTSSTNKVQSPTKQQQHQRQSNQSHVTAVSPNRKQQRLEDAGNTLSYCHSLLNSKFCSFV
jgi:hypothetical protein